MSGVDRDVLDFLNGKYGLKSGAIAGSESLRAAVQELESESYETTPCWPLHTEW